MKIPEEVYDQSPADPIGLTVPFLDRPPDWLVLGGLGDVDEVGPARVRWPKVRVVGFDPDARAVEWQLAHSWPADELPPMQVALGEAVGIQKINLSSVCCASLHGAKLVEVDPGELSKCIVTTLDRAEEQLGPFVNSVLWLDLEGYERQALLGARQLLLSDRVQLLCIEVWYKNEADNRAVNQYLEHLGWERVWVWFRQWWGHNEFWQRKNRFKLAEGGV